MSTPRCQLCLRSVLILTVCVMLVGWLCWWSHKARQQELAVMSLLHHSDGMVRYDFQLNTPRPSALRDQPPLWPERLVNALGVDYFADVEMARLSGENIYDHRLEELEILTDLQILDLHDSRVTDAGLKYLKGLTVLQSLDLRGTQVTDAGVARLQEALPRCLILR